MKVRSFRDLDVFQTAFATAQDIFQVSTQVWLLFALECGYLDKKRFDALFDKCDKICAQLVRMMERPEQWCSDVGARSKR